MVGAAQRPLDQLWREGAQSPRGAPRTLAPSTLGALSARTISKHLGRILRFDRLLASANPSPRTNSPIHALEGLADARAADIADCASATSQVCSLSPSRRKLSGGSHVWSVQATPCPKWRSSLTMDVGPRPALRTSMARAGSRKPCARNWSSMASVGAPGTVMAPVGLRRPLRTTTLTRLPARLKLHACHAIDSSASTTPSPAKIVVAKSVVWTVVYTTIGAAAITART
jgi:hypothetical protein